MKVVLREAGQAAIWFASALTVESRHTPLNATPPALLGRVGDSSRFPRVPRRWATGGRRAAAAPVATARRPAGAKRRRGSRPPALCIFAPALAAFTPPVSIFSFPVAIFVVAVSIFSLPVSMFALPVSIFMSSVSMFLSVPAWSRLKSPFFLTETKRGNGVETFSTPLSSPGEAAVPVSASRAGEDNAIMRWSDDESASALATFASPPPPHNCRCRGGGLHCGDVSDESS